MRLTEIQKELLKEEEKELCRKLGMGMGDNNSLEEIRQLIKTSEKIVPTESETVEPGKEFTVSLDYGDDDKEILTGILVEERTTLISNNNLISVQSPLGQAILGQPIGKEFNYNVQKTFHVSGRILDANIPTIERAKEIVKTK